MVEGFIETVENSPRIKRKEISNSRKIKSKKIGSNRDKQTMREKNEICISLNGNQSESIDIPTNQNLIFLDTIWYDLLNDGFILQALITPPNKRL